MVNAEKLKRYVELELACRRAKDEHEAACAARDCMEDEVLRELADSGLDKVSIKAAGASWTISPSATLYARKKDGAETPDVVAAIKRAHLAELLGYNAARLSAWVRERLADGKPLPPSIAAVIETETRTYISVRAAGETESQSRRAEATLERLAR